MNINMQGCAEERQLLRCQAWIFAPTPFVPGVFADRADKEEMPVGFQCRYGILS